HTAISPRSLHDALPILQCKAGSVSGRARANLAANVEYRGKPLVIFCAVCYNVICTQGALLMRRANSGCEKGGAHMLSMTGYGRGEYRQGGIELSVEIKTVNNRYL